MSQDPDDDHQPNLDQLVEARLSRRTVVAGVLGLPLLACAGRQQGSSPPGPAPTLGFAPVPVSREDAVVLPPGYGFRVVNAWGDPVVAGAPPFADDASQSAAVQALQAGMGHDGMEFFPMPRDARPDPSRPSEHGLLAMNFEYTDDGLLHRDGMEPWTAEKVQKCKNAHGLGVIEVKQEGGIWSVVSGSRYGRRITADTPIELRGPAAGHPRMRTAADPEGRTVLGTFNNCAAGRTPWGTYLACEENFAPYFVNDSGTTIPAQERIGIPTSKASWGYRWQDHDQRFDAARHPNEVNRFGWVVEIDPYDSRVPPVKRTALGRMAHEGATVTVAPDGRVVVYLGDDDFRSKFEHVYKYVSHKPHQRGEGPASNQHLLDEGILYTARFDADGTGEWIPLIHGENGLVATAGFEGQADVMIDARRAADLVGATYLDRPEWTALHPYTGEVYLSLTGNTSRGQGKPKGRDRPLGADGPNPRAPNPMGHIVRWREQGADPAATRFQWDIFVQAGDPAHPDPLMRGNARGAVAFSQPDGLRFDGRGVLWIATDASAPNMARADWERIGNNQLLAADPTTGELRRFLTGPRSCEITGVVFAPDMRTMFVNIQHPGESPDPNPNKDRNDPARPRAHSSWPGGPSSGRPRSATIAVRRDDGGVIGT